MITFVQKQYTKWDQTDQLKQMKDSDILAEKKKSNASMNRKGMANTLLGGAIGTVGGALLGKKVMGGGKFLGKVGAVGGGLLGGALGSTIAGAGTYAAQSKKRSENEFYNDRLEYAKRQAVRREKKDWKNNMTNREGYTY